MGDHFHTRKDEVAVFWIPADPTIPMGLKVVANRLTELQRLVGGDVEPLPGSLLVIPDLPCGCSLDVLSNMDGLPLRLDPNLRATKLWQPPSNRRPEFLVGDVAIIGVGLTKMSDGEVEPDWWGLPEGMKLWQGPGHPLPEGV